MFLDLKRFGAIDDVGLNLHWDAGMLASEVARRAAKLAQLKIGPGSVVAISHSGSACFFADLLAVWTVGAAAACLDGTLTEGELSTLIDFAKPAALLVNQPTTSIALTVPILELAGSRALHPSAGFEPISEFDLDCPALILFTSGTTGSPKGVVLTHRALQTRIELNLTTIGAAALKRTLVTLPTHFGHGLIGNALTPLLNGGTIVLYASGMSLAEQLGAVIDKHRISFLTSVPALWNIAIRCSDPPTGNSLIRVHVGSAPLSTRLWSEIAAWSRAEVFNCYGMTETANWIAGASSRADGIAEGLVGKTWGGVAAVMDDGGHVHRAGVGEIVVQSPCLLSGYLNRPDLSAAALPQGWFRTGDRGSVDEGGRIWLTGRIKDEINRAGFKVQPAEVDLLLETHPAVAEACVFAIPDAISGEVIGAAVRLARGGAADADSLHSWCRERLRRAAVPERWFIVDSIPRNARGKVNRDVVRRRLIGSIDIGAPVMDTSRPRTETTAAEGGRRLIEGLDGRTGVDVANRVGAAVERAWTSVLDRRSFRANMPWDLAGGDSIGAMRLWLQIEQKLSVQLPLDQLRFNTTPRLLIRTIEELLEPGKQPTIDNLRQQIPLIFLMPPAHGDTPSLAQFRAAFDGRIRFEVIQYPRLNEMINGRAEFNVMVDAAVTQVLANGNHDACYLAGYSFGGFVAWETARRLIGSGRRVDFLGLIDTRLVAPPRERKSIFAKARGYVRRRWPSTKLQERKTSRLATHVMSRAFFASFRDACAAAYQDILWHLFEILARRCPLSVLRRINRLVEAISGSAAIAFQLELLARLRLHALQRVTIESLDVSTTLFRSDEWCAGLPDYGWSGLCKQLVVVPIRGGHLSLFEPEFRKLLCARFLQAVETVTASRRTNTVKTGT